MTSPSSTAESTLSALEEAELLRLVREEEDWAAAGVLLERHLPWVYRVVANQARRQRLGREDVEEARVEAAWAVLVALPDFSPEKDCCLHTYLGPVITNCVRNLARHVRSVQRAYDRSARVAGLSGGGPDDGVAVLPRAVLAGTRSSDPAAVAERDEALALLEQVLDEQGARARWLWQGLVARRPLGELAHELTLTYKQTRRVRERLETVIRDRLGTCLA